MSNPVQFWSLAPKEVREDSGCSERPGILQCRGLNYEDTSEESLRGFGVDSDDETTPPVKKKQTKKRKQDKKNILQNVDVYKCNSCEMELNQSYFSKNQLKKFKSGSGTCTNCIMQVLAEQKEVKEEKNWRLRHVPPPKVEGAVWDTKETRPIVKLQTPPNHNSLDSFPLPPKAEPCSICYGYFDHGKDFKTSCGHRFHRECLDQWICSNLQSGTEPSCPNCRITIQI